MPHHVMLVRLHCTPTTRLAAVQAAPLRFRQERLHGAATTPVCALIAFLHCELVRKTFVAKLGVRLQIRAKSLYQLFEVIQFLKVLNRIVRGRFSLGQSLQVIALGQYNTSPAAAGAAALDDACVL